MKVPKGFEKCHPEGAVSLLLKTVCGLKQASFECWKALPNATKSIKLNQSEADPCVCFKWTDQGLMIWSSWVDDIPSHGNEDKVIEGRQKLKEHFDLDEVGESKEHVGCKITTTKKKARWNQHNLCWHKALMMNSSHPKEKLQHQLHQELL